MQRMIRGGAVLALLLAGVAFRPSTGAARERAAADVTVSVDWLAQHIKDRDVVILQVSPRAEYDKEHIPGARSIDPRTTDNFEAPMGTGADMDMTTLLSEAALHAKLEKFGISDGSHVVVAFGSPSVVMATRTIFLLRYAGVENVSLLDGGLAAWKRGGHPVSTVAPAVVPGHYTRHIQPAIAVNYAYVQAHLNTPHFRIIDAREPVYYHSAAPISGMTPGHVPGAGNVPFNSLFDDTSGLRPPSVIEASFRAAGVQPGDTVIAYCHVGLQATAVVLSARSVGIPVKMYVGSFHDWTAHNLPTEIEKQ
jgi:thiosulfate/3-mercaptopyruvate sulfurtransferase